jgi:hypothetical protein
VPMLADLGRGSHRGRHQQAHPHRSGGGRGTGATLAQRTVSADADGYQVLRELADQHPGRQVWARGQRGAGSSRMVPTWRGDRADVADHGISVLFYDEL